MSGATPNPAETLGGGEAGYFIGLRSKGAHRLPQSHGDGQNQLRRPAGLRALGSGRPWPLLPCTDPLPGWPARFARVGALPLSAPCPAAASWRCERRPVPGPGSERHNPPVIQPRHARPPLTGTIVRAVGPADRSLVPAQAEGSRPSRARVRRSPPSDGLPSSDDLGSVGRLRGRPALI
jgi:hypothetical protein